MNHVLSQSLTQISHIRARAHRWPMLALFTNASFQSYSFDGGFLSSTDERGLEGRPPIVVGESDGKALGDAQTPVPVQPSSPAPQHRPKQPLLAATESVPQYASVNKRKVTNNL